MNKKVKFILISVIIILLIIGIYLFALSTISISKMKYCISKEDCISVDCGCGCSGCGGFSYDDIVNKKYAKAWYLQQGCLPSGVCPEVCCMPRTIECENNACVAKEAPGDY
ncbi:MAG: hypothetical protein NTZ83_03665 [Candidatus Pacearchaeota archaeon]|nr:hypothetical protein [Candidatus Pacearchaeota archaeon]